MFMAPCKGTYFFDNHCDRGFDWYRQQFCRAKDESVIGEISHSYLYSPVTAARIAESMPNAKLMVCLLLQRQIHVQLFDDLKTDPQQCADDLFAFLGTTSRTLSEAHRKKMMPAARPRSSSVTLWAKRLAHLTEQAGLRGFRGRMKRSPLVRNLLHRPYTTEELPRMNPVTRDLLKEKFREKIADLDKIIGTSLTSRWSYN